MTIGRPKLIKTPEEMQEKIDAYFDTRQPEIIGRDKSGQPIIELNPPTMSGLAMAIGFNRRQTLYDYEGYEEFADTIKRARLRIENFLESNSMSGSIPPSVGIFMLKNFGWTDRQEIEHSSNPDKPLTININPVKPIE